MACAVAMGTFVSTSSAEHRLTDPPMASFDRMVARHSPHQRFERGVLGAVDHTLGTNAKLARALSAGGIPPQKIRWMSKGYSDQAAVIEEMRADGYGFRSAHPSFRLGYLPRLNSFTVGASDPDAQLVAMLTAAVREARQTGFLLLNDDDGRLITLLHTRFRDALPLAVAVARTSRVTDLAASMKLEMPVVDMGREWGKTHFETPSIGRSVGQASEAKVVRLEHAGIAIPRRALIIGAGNVGMAAGRYLNERGFEVELYDESAATRERVRSTGEFVMHVDPDTAYARANILLSTTGKSPRRKLDLLPNHALLINGSSGVGEVTSPDRQRRHPGDERDGNRLFSQFAGRRVELGDVSRPGNLDAILETEGGKQLYLANDGGVVNFNYGPTPWDPIPARYIQLTRGLNYLALEQAASLVGAPGGLYKMPAKAVRRYVGSVEAELRLTGETLLRPSF